jgi:class 3 adenylate cyclase/tetratricopeptide (TPR) repeat protein
MPRCAACGHVSAEDFKFCPECGTPAAAAARAERKTVTVLFCDIVGSTELGEALDPESVRAVLGRFFDMAQAVVERHGGSVEKFIGDAVMAVFGVPVLHEDDALRAVRAAADLRGELAMLNDELDREYGRTLALRVGINTGEVVTGTEERLATGDAVNVAARLEQNAGPGQILLGEPTFERVRDAVQAEPLPDLPLKGKSEPVPAWALQDVRADEGRRLSAVPMVGREQELGVLRGSFAEAVETRSCRLVTIVGPAGVGKSRLVAEALVGLDGARVLQGRCLSYGDGITYWPVVEIVRQLQDELDELPDARVIGALRGLMSAAPATSSTEEIAWAVRKLLESAAAERPVVCVLDDVNWGEETFLDLVEQVAALARGAPLLLVCMARPDLLDRRPGWGGGSLNAVNVLLEPLSDTQADALIEQLLGGAELEEELRGRIRDGAEGNPLFVEEMIAMLRETGKGDGDVAVPATIQGLLASRLDQLPPAERSVLECGSVEGRVFHRGAVQALSPAPQLGSLLAALVRKDLVRPDLGQLPGDDAYRFRHVLIREAAYDALPKATRASLHERLADWLEQHSEEVLEADEVRGYHLEHAYRYRQELAPGVAGDEPVAARAADLLESAGKRALARLDVGAARSLFERALSLRPEADPAVTLRLDLAEVLFLSGDASGASEVAADAAVRARETGYEAGRLRAELMAARITALTANEVHAGGADASGALLTLAAEARPVFASSSDEIALTEAWVATAWGELIRCQYASMLEAVEQALQHAAYARYTRWERELPVWKGTALFYGPTPVEEVLRWLEQEQPRHAIALRQQGVLEAMRGRFDEARALLAAGDAAAEELGQTIWLAVGGMTAWEVETLAGETAAAERAARECCDRLEELGDTGYRATATARLADSLLGLGRLEEAERETELAEALAAPDDRVSQALWRQVRAKLRARSGRHDEAQALARAAVALFAETDMVDYHAHALADLAEVLRPAGSPAEPLEQAVTLFERKGNAVAAERVRASLVEIPLAPG